jgi:hypothetical protein
MVMTANVNIRSSLMKAERFVPVGLKSNDEKRCPIDKTYVTKVVFEGIELSKTQVSNLITYDNKTQ